jgi:hypothetical protein
VDTWSRASDTVLVGARARRRVSRTRRRSPVCPCCAESPRAPSRPSANALVVDHWAGLRPIVAATTHPILGADPELSRIGVCVRLLPERHPLRPLGLRYGSPKF